MKARRVIASSFGARTHEVGLCGEGVFAKIGTRTVSLVSLGLWQQAPTEIEDREMAAKKSKSSKSRAGAKKAPKKPRGEKHIQLAEDTGLAQLEVLKTEPTAPNLPNSLDRQFDYWMTAIRMSVWPTVLHQQIRMARTVLEFWLPKERKDKTTLNVRS